MVLCHELIGELRSLVRLNAECACAFVLVPLEEVWQSEVGIVHTNLLNITETGQFFKMKYIVGINQKNALYIARFSSRDGYLSCISSIPKAVNGIESHKTKPRFLGKWLTKGLPVLLLQSIFSLYSILFTLAIKYGALINVNNKIAIPPGIISLKIWAIKIHKDVPTKNITFQKLSLFSLACKKLALPGTADELATTPCKFDCVDGSTCDFGMFSQLKSSMTILCNLWLHIYSIIISNYYNFTKQIKALVLVLSFILCFHCSLVFAKNEPATQYSQEYIASLISNAEKKNQIPSGLLAAIARVESNTKAYALNINGNTVLNASLEETSEVVKKKLAVGMKNIDLGIMQLNYRWHGDKFNNVTQMLMPENNITYAASLLKSLRVQHGTWHKAIKYYHSAKPEHHRKYSRRVVAYWLVRDRTRAKEIRANSY